jgi:manganese-dependent inorganic pyrophosphatase
VILFIFGNFQKLNFEENKSIHLSRSPITTNDDRKIVEYLLPLTKIADIKSYAGEMFEAKSDLQGFSAQQILLLDYKTYTFNHETWGIGTGETCNMKKMLERKDELLQAMQEEKKKKKLNGILFSIVDIMQEKNLTLIPGEIEDKVVRQAFKTEIKHQIADLGSRVSRKKQIIPTLEAYFHQKSF